MRVATFLNLSIYAITSLCHSAFVRVATVYLDILLCCAYFATAHSCGLRLLVLFALVHRASLPQRIRAGCDADFFPPLLSHAIFATAHSCGLRLSCSITDSCPRSLPQRIRAGCDSALRAAKLLTLKLCHSAFVRVATTFHVIIIIGYILCHSAFVRVATTRGLTATYQTCFATAHSCGLRLARSARAPP